MILEAIDQGRLERLAVVNGSAGKGIDGRTYIGGYHLNSGGYGSIRDCVTDEIVFDGLGYERMKVSNPFVYIQTRSY